MESGNQYLLDLVGLKNNDFFISKNVSLYHRNKKYGSVTLEDGHVKFHFEPSTNVAKAINDDR